MLFEGTFEYYNNIDQTRAQKYLQMAADAAQLVITSNKWNFGSDFKSLFASENLAGNPEVLMYRAYDATQQVTHAVGSYSNGNESQTGANLVFIKSFIVNDGNVWQNSMVPNANSFSIGDLVKTRDPRFEATFIDRPIGASSSLLYSFKHASRDVLNFIGITPPIIWGSNTNTNDAPIIRLGEVVLNWIEAKAELAERFGGTAISQGDIDKSINAIRKRPLDGTAAAKGIQKTADLKLGNLPNDPTRDSDVPALIWEVRRERRMELFYEGSRILDLRRWKKLNYMDYSTNPDYFLGPWVNLQTEFPSILTAANANKVKVKKADGTEVTWNGSNQSSMVGYYMVLNAKNRNSFTDKNYLSPVGTQQINEYKNKGYNLTQTKGW
jgi:hypothetical protein